LSGPARSGAVAPRFAWAFATAFLCLILPVRSAFASYWAGLAGVAVAAALFVLPLLYTVPRTRPVWTRRRGWLLAAQAVLTYLPFAVFGQDWVVSLSGLLGGLLLLTTRAPVSWLSFGAVLAVDGLLRVGVLPVPGASLSLTASVFIVPVSMALALFGLVRLADLVTDLHATRTELADLAVGRQRVRSASRLREAIGDRLETVTAHAEAALRVLPRSPDQARGELTEAAGLARQALDQVRMVTADNGRDHHPPPSGRTDDSVAPRLARLVLVVVLGAVTAQLLLNVLASAPAATAAAGAAAAVTTVVALQLYHSLARRNGNGPRGWVWTLAVQTLVSVASFQVFDEVSLLALAAFPAGSALLLLPGRWAWAAFMAILASVWTLMAAYSPYGLYDAVNVGAGAAAYGLVVYGLSRLTDLAQRVEVARRELARMAVARERLRVARDTHDLLGLGLSAVALKCDLVGRLIGRDDAKARRELQQLVTVASRAHRDVLSVTDEGRHGLSLHTELIAARDTLAAAGVEVHGGVPAGPVPPAVDAVLATVLREAITNILRHTTAEQCTIELSTTRQGVRLHVINDGVRSPGPTGATGGGAGIGNLGDRVRALGGRLTAGPDGEGRFELAVEIPVTP
jgi:two-component system, NarL family, sensor histidine kinase DesK